MDVWAGIHDFGMESMVYLLLEQFPFSQMLMGLFVVTIVFSFATMTDSLVATLAIISTKGVRVGEEPPRRLKVLWGVVIGLIAYVLCICAGSNRSRADIPGGIPHDALHLRHVRGARKGWHIFIGQTDWVDNEAQNG